MQETGHPIRLAGLIALLLIEVAEAYACLPCTRVSTLYTECKIIQVQFIRISLVHAMPQELRKDKICYLDMMKIFEPLL